MAQDFNMSHAQPLLDRYRHHHSTFNDDIQGTAATALAGLYGAMKARHCIFSIEHGQFKNTPCCLHRDSGLSVAWCMIRTLQRCAANKGTMILQPLCISARRAYLHPTQ